MSNYIVKSFLISLVLVSSFSCKKNLVSTSNDPSIDLEKNVSNISEMVVPKGFKYETVKKFSLTITPDFTMQSGEIRKVSVFNGNPHSDGKLLGNYLLSHDFPLQINLSFASAIEKIFLIVQSSSGQSQTYIIPTTGNTYKLSLNALQKKPNSLFKSIPLSPNCNIGCTSSASGSNQNLTLNNATDVVCITGNFDGNVNINRGIVRVCGSARFRNISINNDGALLIAAGAQVEFDNFNLNTSASVFRNWSDNVKFNASFNPNGIVNNYAKIEINGDLNINGSSSFVNDGLLKIGGDFNNNKIFTNSGSLEIGKSFTINGGSSTINNCYIKIGSNFTLNNSINNNSGQISVSKTTTVNGGGVLNLNDAAMLDTKDLMLNNIVFGSGSTSLLKVSGNTTINGGGRLNGVFSFCDLNGIETNWGQISNSVVQSCATYIPKSACNLDGNGEAPKPLDLDKDGVEDVLDDYPEDNQKAFNNYYPNISDFVSVAFEDLWPSKGDYDLNDCVVDFRYNMVTNSKNQVTSIEATYVLRASGGSQAIAFCHNFPIKATEIAEVKGAALEEKNETAVITIFTNSKEELKGQWNTVPGQAISEPKQFNVVISLKNPVSLENLGGISEFDPFIWINEKSKGRGYEIHLPGKAATSYADKKWFGYADDNSNDGENNYLTKNDLPWAVLIPEKFDYCSELKTFNKKEITDITQVYLHFAQWAQSGGKFFPDWYRNEKGYRNEDYIHVK
ncbi:MAG: LruC domain-containing protein [Bacteroidia bacterium]